MKCKCYINHGQGDVEEIIQCPLCKAAPALLEACEDFNFRPDCGGDFCIDEQGEWAEDCEHRGYCQWAYSQTQKFKAAIAQGKK